MTMHFYSVYGPKLCRRSMEVVNFRTKIGYKTASCVLSIPFYVASKGLFT